jgi:hypothetical protein
MVVGNKGSIVQSDTEKLRLTSGEENAFDYENQRIYNY